MSETLENLDQLRRDAEVWLKDLELALVRAHLAYLRPSQAAQPLEGRLRDLYRRMDQEASIAPHVRSYLDSLRGFVEARRRAMLEEAERAWRQRGVLEPGMAASYNQALGRGLSRLPGATTRLAERQVEDAVRRLVDAVVNQPQVPGHVRAQMARSLSDWILHQEQVQEAFYAVEAALLEVSRFLQEKLSLHAEIVSTRDRVRACGEITQQQACEADQRVGTLAQRSRDADQEIGPRIEQAVTRVRGYFRLDPKLVLDPSKAFLGSLQSTAGIQLRQNGVTVDLGAKVRVIDPLQPSQVDLNPYLQVTSGNLSVGVQGQSSYQTQGGSWQHSVRATLTWRF